MVRLYDRAMREVKEYYEKKLEEADKHRLEAEQEAEQKREKKRKQEAIDFYNKEVPVDVISSVMNIQEEEILSFVQEDLEEKR